MNINMHAFNIVGIVLTLTNEGRTTLDSSARISSYLAKYFTLKQEHVELFVGNCYESRQRHKLMCLKRCDDDDTRFLMYDFIIDRTYWVYPNGATDLSCCRTENERDVIKLWIEE